MGNWIPGTENYSIPHNEKPDTMYKHFMFDLDGTLLNTLPDLADSGNEALTQMGFPVHPVDCYRYFVGNGMEELIKRLLPESCKGNLELGAKLLRLYTDEYHRRWDKKTKPYEGMPETLAQLKQKGFTLSVFSNKPDEFTQNCIRHFFPEGTFAIVRGFRQGVPRKPAPDGALSILEELKLTPDQVYYVGDTCTDMETAHAAGFYAIGVEWGFRDYDELKRNNADAIIQNPSQLLTFEK